MANSFLLDLLFPKRCVSCRKFGVYLCRDCFSKIEFIEKPICPVCERQAVGGKTHPGCFSKFGLDGLVVAARYRGPVKAAIVKVKYKWIYSLGEVLVDLLAENLWKFSLPLSFFVIPVPLHAKRRRWRGFNQAEILAKVLRKKFGQEYLDILVRTRETRPQVELKKDERKKNVLGAFSVKRRFGLHDRDFVLIDDVYTTGATMGECAKILKRSGARSVWGMAVALG